jgi:hypothetical protein
MTLHRFSAQSSCPGINNTTRLFGMEESIDFVIKRLFRSSYRKIPRLYDGLFYLPTKCPGKTCCPSQPSTLVGWTRAVAG